MRGAFIFALLWPLWLAAYQYEQVLLRTEARLAPRILLMTNGVSYFAANRFTVCIIGKEEDDAAKQFRQYLAGYYPNGWQYHTMQTVISDFASMQERCRESEMLFVLRGSTEEIRQVVEYAASTRKVTMSYLWDYLDDGILVSLYVGKDIKPYLNMTRAKQSGFVFDNDLKRVSKFWYVRPGAP